MRLQRPGKSPIRRNDKKVLRRQCFTQSRLFGARPKVSKIDEVHENTSCFRRLEILPLVEGRVSVGSGGCRGGFAEIR
ncbi:hypothetical protein, partial [Phycobacter sp. K97]|uniref:hypothetical protein n=1 Tax=Phycobacter sedimenti TaxID=3133977 RepID=UPI00311DE8AB